MSVQKPQLRGLLQSGVKGNIAAMVAASVTGALLWKFLYMEPKKQKYADFYKTYDAEKSLQRMLDAGLMEATD